MVRRVMAPAEVTGLSVITFIYAFSSSNLALKNDATLWGWIDNTSCQLGNGYSIRSHVANIIFGDFRQDVVLPSVTAFSTPSMSSPPGPGMQWAMPLTYVINAKQPSIEVHLNRYFS